MRFFFRSKGRYMTSEIKILSRNLALWEGHFDHFQDQNISFMSSMNFFLELFRSCLGIIFGLKGSILGVFYMTSKIENFSPNLALWEGHFDDFQGQKIRFMSFLKVGLELFRSCLGISFCLKGLLSGSKGRYWPLKPKF